MSIGIKRLLDITLKPETSEHYHFDMKVSVRKYIFWDEEKVFHVYCEKEAHSWFYEKYTGQYFSGGLNINVCGGPIRAMLLERMELAND